MLELNESRSRKIEETMCDYSNLPQLPFDEILSYLSVKEQIRCKAVCRNWKCEIERWEKSRQSLVFHLRAFLTNVKWTHSATLMRLENSFQTKSLDFLRRPFTQSYFKRMKKVAILDIHVSHLFGNNRHQRFSQCINWLAECVELEVFGLYLEGKTTFDLPKLKVLVLRKVDANHMEFKCPALEVLVLQSKVKQIEFKNTKSLKHLSITNTGGLNFRSSTSKFSSLECMNLFNNDFLRTSYQRELDQIREDLLRYTPKLKKLICYSANAGLSFAQLQAQKARYGLKDLQILMAGFRETRFDLVRCESQFMITEESIDGVFDNFAKLVEPCHWDTHIDYSVVTEKFRILPSTFFTKFPNVISFEIKQITSYNHLFGFLKHCPRVVFLQICGCLVESDFLAQLFLLTPSVRVLSIKRIDEPSALLDFDFLALRNLKLTICKFFCAALPIQIIEKILKSSKSLINLKYAPILSSSQMVYELNIYIGESRFYLKHGQMGVNEELAFKTIDQLARHLRESKLSRPFLLA